MLLDLSIWERWLPFVALIVAIFVVKIAYVQVHVGREEARRAAANNIYQQYLTLCFENSKFAKGLVQPSGTNNLDYSKYCWFVSMMLFSFEQIIEINVSEEKWHRAIKLQLLRHKDFLNKSSTVREEQWDDRLIGIINEL
ncbi:hypothetical protein Ping_2679 [Psychromonas ingrahamii 37]|uniref:DUF4760 domain-containing protein n=1 Tax=Psychromonas ingrahamii (strain DSM 17664 / CCUG 51855 / 37) TaxID=357804 RepID=A1SY26_PSYIN|nr:hypothetical protein [Psychromonas ingrahamii]ABM04391.1 hypothetical protein Ping_2679 [Psychromonas ingrahamii 37]